MYDKSKKSWSQRLKTLSSSTNNSNNSNDNSGPNPKNVTLGSGSGMQAMQQLQLHMQQAHQQHYAHQQQLQLQLPQQQQQHRLLHPHPHLTAAYQLPPPGYEFLPGALSRSMKYAEPWIYGTVRGIPLRPSGYGYHHHHHQHQHQQQQQQQQHPHAAAIFATETEPGLAVVICSCAEYLSGTKRDVKKASICKKCKGSRLPLATIGGGGGALLGGGTLRLTAATCNSNHGRSMAATMRVVSSTKKSRPSILDPQKDPYDLMRRTRLLSPEPTTKSENTKDGNGKSRNRDTAGEGTQRGRSRTRAPLPPMPKAKPEPADCWLMEDNELLLQSSGLATTSSNSSNRNGSNNCRSILRCNVNPYELISVDKKKNLSNSLPIHVDDDFDVADAQLMEDEDQQQLKKQKQQQQQQQQQHQERKFYGNKVTAIAGQRISLGSDNLSNDLGDSSDSYEKIIIAATAATSPIAAAAAATMATPRRPPRNKKSDEPIENLREIPAPLLALTTIALPTNTSQLDVAEDDNDNSSFTLLTVTPTSPAIKSILKRPVTLDLPTATAAAATVAVVVVDQLGADKDATAATPLLTPSSKSQFYIPTPMATPTNPYTPTPTSTTSTSSSRKKVQFMVEDKIIATTATTTTTTTTTTGATAATTDATATTDDSNASHIVVVDETTAATTNYEYYNRKRNAAAAAAASANQAQQEATRQKHRQLQQQQLQLQQQQQQQQEMLSAFAADVDDDHNFTASAEMTTTKPNSLQYEDVMLPGQQQIFDPTSNSNSNSNTNVSQNAEILPTSTASKLLLSAVVNGDSTAAATLPHVSAAETRTSAETTAAAAAAAVAAATAATATVTNRDYDDDDEHNDKDATKNSSNNSGNNSDNNSGNNSGNKSGNNNKSNNNKAKEKLKQKEETDKKQEKEKEKERKGDDGNAKPRASQKRAQQMTQSQSRNPIRRAHSERHLSNSKTATSTPQQHSSHQATSNNSNRNSGPPNVILNFKDTMALRIKSNRNDSRDLFQRRPTEPPPPPPTTTSTTTTTSVKASTAGTRQQQHHPRTVVRVAPFNKNQQNGEVHRLKISHSEEEVVVLRHKTTTTNNNSDNSNNSSNITTSTTSRPLEEEDKKTSILINGDDCYSTMNLSADAAQPLYQSSVVVNSHSTAGNSGSIGGSVCINVSSLAEQEEQLNQLNMLNSQQMAAIAIIPIKSSEVNLQRSVSCISSTSSSSTSSSSSSSGRGRTLIRLDYEKEKKSLTKGGGAAFSSTTINMAPSISSTPPTPPPPPPPLLPPPISQPPAVLSASSSLLVPHETELLKILRNPVEAVKRNLVPHVCGLNETKKSKDTLNHRSFMSKLLEDPIMGQVADGLDQDTVAELIENSLQRLQQSRRAIDMSGTKDHDDMNRLISISLKRIRQERQPAAAASVVATTKEEDDRLSQRGSISSANSFASAHNYELFDFEANSNNESDCYQSCSSVIEEEVEERKDLNQQNEEEDAATRDKFYQLLVDATLAEIELSTHTVEEAEHHYESIRQNGDPIYEEIHEKPPPLPLSAPPVNEDELMMEKKSARSIFEGASKYDILSYLVDAKERGLAREESFDYSNNPKIIEEEATDTLSELEKRSSLMEDNVQSNMNSLSPPPHTFMCGKSNGGGSDVERQDSGVGSETSKSSRSKYQATPTVLHLCEDCDGPVETQLSEAGVLFAPLVCRKCGKKRVERKEIITEIVETEEKYGRDLQIILEEFCHPMLVAGLLNQEQLSAIFLNTEDLLENNHLLADRMRDALDIALEQGDDDLLTVNIGRIFLDFTQMLHAFESYCVRQAGASLLLANLEKEKELLRIFLKVSQMENAVLRRMNLNSFLMVPVQRVTKYPLLLARLFKVTPSHLDGRELLKQAQEKIELHLNHINQEAKDVPTKLWRRISSSSPNRRASCEIDMINIKLRKMAIDILEWNHDEVRFAMEGKLLYTQPTDSNWKKARTIKLTPVNALLVTNGKPSANYRAEKAMSDKLNFPKHTGIREASLLMVKEKCGRYTLIREPLYLDRCVVCSEADWDDYFEVQEISSKDTFIFKAEDGVRTKQWYTQLQYHAQGMGAWRKRRNALANIMINGMLARS